MPTLIYSPLIIQTGADWIGGVNLPIPLSAVPVAPVMEIRRDLSPSSQRLARLDTTNSADGTIRVISTSQLAFHLDHSVTTSLPTGRGFWDILGQVNGQLQLIASGTVEIEPHVTNYANI